jgi:hypothetical protein
MDSSMSKVPWAGKSFWAVVVSSSLILTAGCCHTEDTAVSLGSPFDRYDHNRTRRLAIQDPGDTVGEAPAGAPLARFHFYEIADYAPQAKQQFVVEFLHKDARAQSDNLSPAILVPTYPGVMLPLSDAPITECAMCKSDRADLVDFLATGPAAQAGVQAPEMAGDLKRAERDFKPILDVLTRGDLTRLDGAGLKKLLPQKEVVWAAAVNDTRYAAGAIGTTLAFRYRCFWFVLYRYPNQSGFTRLVVVKGTPPTDPGDKAPDAASC